MPSNPFAHVAVDAEDALDIHAAFECRRYGTQLDFTQLRNRRDTRREDSWRALPVPAPPAWHLYRPTRRFRMIRIEAELGFVLLLSAEPVEAFDSGAAMRAFHPLACRPPLKFSRFRRLAQRFARA
jgi:hypothetical protein